MTSLHPFYILHVLAVFTMSMLAEPRKRQKFSINPRGIDWVNDETKFGQKLMERMGWTKGKGLGANEDGRQENVKVKFKDDNTGVGCTKRCADNWIAHQDDFNNLLANLNSDNVVTKEEMVKTAKVSSLEEKSKSSRKRVHYQKFTKGKDLSTRSLKDLNCIFGIKDSKLDTECKVSSENTLECTKESTGKVENNNGMITVTSSCSVQEYFAEKMATRLRSRSQTNSPAVSSQSGQDKEANTITELATDADRNCEVEENFNADDLKKRKSKKKKSKKSKSDKADETFGSSECHEIQSAVKQDVEMVDVDAMDSEPKKKKKNMKMKKIGDFLDPSSIQNEVPLKKKSKKNKRKSSVEIKEMETEETSFLDSDMVTENRDIAIVFSLSDSKTKQKKKAKLKLKAGDEMTGSECCASKEKSGNKNDTEIVGDINLKSKSKKKISGLELYNGDIKVIDSCEENQAASQKQIGLEVLHSDSKDTKVTKWKRKIETDEVKNTGTASCELTDVPFKRTKSNNLSPISSLNSDNVPYSRVTGENDVLTVNKEKQIPDLGKSDEIVKCSKQIKNVNGNRRHKKKKKVSKKKGCIVTEVVKSFKGSHLKTIAGYGCSVGSKSNNLSPISSVNSDNMPSSHVTGENNVPTVNKEKQIPDLGKSDEIVNCSKQPKNVKGNRIRKKKSKVSKKKGCIVTEVVKSFEGSHLKNIAGYGCSVGTKSNNLSPISSLNSDNMPSSHVTGENDMPTVNKEKQILDLGKSDDIDNYSKQPKNVKGNRIRKSKKKSKVSSKKQKGCNLTEIFKNFNGSHLNKIAGYGCSVGTSKF